MMLILPKSDRTVAPTWRFLDDQKKELKG